MFKRLGYLFWRPEEAYRELPAKQTIRFTVVTAVLGIMFVSFAGNQFIRPEANYRSLSPHTYEMTTDSAMSPVAPVKDMPSVTPGRSDMPEPDPAPAPGAIRVPFTATLFQAATRFLVFVAGWMLMSFLFSRAAALMGGAGSFAQSVAVTGLSWFPLFLRSVVQGVFIWSTGLPVSWSHPLAEAVFSRLDLFFIWNIILLGIGLSTVFGIRKRSGLLLAAGYRLAVIAAGLGVSIVLQ